MCWPPSNWFRRSAAGSGERLRVMSYNTHAGSDRRRRLNLEAIARTIERGDPDVVALQEVDRHYGERSAYVDQPAWYAERLGMEAHYAATVRLPAPHPGAPEREYGLALLSRLPFTDPLHHPYTFVSGEPRGLVAATVDWNGTPVQVINTHLSVSAAASRTEEARELAERLTDLDQPVVVAGDFNARHRAPELSPIRDLLTDSWRAGFGPGLTCAGRRIDFIWATPSLRPVRSRVLLSLASDHFPVVTELVLAP